MKNGFDTESNTFEVVSGKLVVSDPCYEPDTWCAATLNNVKNGAWKMQTTMSDEGIFGERVSELEVYCIGSDLPSYSKADVDIGVDSGQAGIFDQKFFRDDKIVAGASRLGKDKQTIICVDEPWYSICCDRTLLPGVSSGVIPYGAVSSSGFGDGSYDCYVAKDYNGQVTGVKIVFIDEEDDEICCRCGSTYSSEEGECPYCDDYYEKEDDI